MPAKASNPKKQIIALRLPTDVMKRLGAVAGKQHVSRNKLVEFILRDYLMERGETFLRTLVREGVNEGGKDASVFS